jgi:Amino acid kinase family
MADAVRTDLVSRADPVVVKVGTNVLADTAGILDRRRVQALADQLARVRAGGRRVALVSSGAISDWVGGPSTCPISRRVPPSASAPSWTPTRTPWSGTEPTSPKSF